MERSFQFLLRKKNPNLTSGEVGNLWEQYMGNSASAVVLEHFIKHLTDEGIKSVCSQALQNTENHKENYKNMLNQGNYPLPTAFTATDDLNVNAPKMVTDEFVLFQLHYMSKLDLALTASCLVDSVREDIRKLFSERMDRAKALYEQSTSLLLQKGLYVRYIGKSLLMALQQTNTNSEITELLLRGKELSSKIMQELSQVLTQNDLPVSMSWDTHVLDSKISPFSNRLIAFLLDEMNKFGLANYGYGAAISTRKDLKTLYLRIITDVYQYQDDVRKLMIENHWLEKPPVAMDRAALSHA
jgi:hypothetical protein